MADNRTLVQKLQAMANQTASPHEAEIAKAKLKAMGASYTVPPTKTFTQSYAKFYDDAFDIEKFYADFIKKMNEQEEKRKKEQFYQEFVKREWYNKTTSSGQYGNPYKPEGPADNPDVTWWYDFTNDIWRKY